MENDTILIPAGGRILEGIKKRQKIRQLLAEGLGKNQISGAMDISTTAVNKHLKIIAAEDAEQAKESQAV